MLLPNENEVETTSAHIISMLSISNFLTLTQAVSRALESISTPRMKLAPSKLDAIL
jgi:hypothetical protein